MSMIIRTTESQGPSFASHIKASVYESPEAVAAKILDAAQQDASELLRVGREEAETILEEARLIHDEAAREAAAASQSMEERLQQHLQTRGTAAGQLLESIIHEVHSQRDEWLAVADRQTLELAIAIAEHIVRATVAHDSTVAVRLTRETLELVSGTQSATVFVNPQDLEEHYSTLQMALNQTRLGDRLQLVADDNMSRGGCRLETEFGCIDQSIETQLARIAEELLHDN